VKVYKTEVLEREVNLGTEYRYDNANDIHKGYVVVGIDLTK